jgi:hypothetical protein
MNTASYLCYELRASSNEPLFIISQNVSVCTNVAKLVYQLFFFDNFLFFRGLLLWLVPFVEFDTD